MLLVFQPASAGKYIRHETHCDTIDSIISHWEIVGYRVKYRYRGHYYWTETDHYPGKYIDIKVKVKTEG